MVNIKMDFDFDKVKKQAESAARKAYLDAAERAKRSLGAKGIAIQITPLNPPRRRGDTVTFAETSFPSKEVGEKFKEALRRNLK